MEHPSPDRLLLFRIDVLRFAVDAGEVARVIARPERVTRTPGASRARPGLFHHAGHVHQLVELAAQLELTPAAAGRVLVYQPPGRFFGLHVDAVDDLVESGGGQWRALPAYLPRRIFPRGFVYEGRLYLYARLDALLDLEDHGPLRHHLELLRDEGALPPPTVTAADPSATPLPPPAQSSERPETGPMPGRPRSAPAATALVRNSPPGATTVSAPLSAETPAGARRPEPRREPPLSPKPPVPPRRPPPSTPSSAVQPPPRPTVTHREPPVIEAEGAAGDRALLASVVLVPLAIVAIVLLWWQPWVDPVPVHWTPPRAALSAPVDTSAERRLDFVGDRPGHMPAPTISPSPSPSPSPSSPTPASEPTSTPSDQTAVTEPADTTTTKAATRLPEPDHEPDGHPGATTFSEQASPSEAEVTTAPVDLQEGAVTATKDDRSPEAFTAMAQASPVEAVIAAAAVDPPPEAVASGEPVSRPPRELVVQVPRAALLDEWLADVASGATVEPAPPAEAPPGEPLPTPEPEPEPAADNTAAAAQPTPAQDGTPTEGGPRFETIAAPPLPRANGEARRSCPRCRFEYVVVRGDTLWSIARRYLRNAFRFRELASASGIEDPDRIYPGDRIVIEVE